MILQLTVDHLHETIDVDYIISCDPLNRASTRRMNFARSELLYSKQGAIRAPDILYQHTPMSIQLLTPASSKLGHQVHCTLAVLIDKENVGYGTLPSEVPDQSSALESARCLPSALEQHAPTSPMGFNYCL